MSELTKGEKTKARIIESFLRLVGRDGIGSATMRSIAKEADVTEGLLYRYFKNKDAMIDEIWGTFMEVMVQEKRTIMSSDTTDEDVFRKWIHTSYRAYDENPAAFALLFLEDGLELGTKNKNLRQEQFKLFKEFMESLANRGLLIIDDATLGTNLFAAQMLVIPRLVHTGRMPGPATQYTDCMTLMTTRVLLKGE